MNLKMIILVISLALMACMVPSCSSAEIREPISEMAAESFTSEAAESSSVTESTVKSQTAEDTTATTETSKAADTKTTEETEGKTKTSHSANNKSTSKAVSDKDSATSTRPSTSAPSQDIITTDDTQPPAANNLPTEPTIPDELKPYAYPFDIEAIRNDLIQYGQSLGMIHVTVMPDGELRTPDNTTWWTPELIYSNSREPAATRDKLFERLAFDNSNYGIQHFTVYIDAGDNGSYRIYFLF